MTDHADEEVDAAIARLGLALGKAVMKEDFEEAARLRGEIDRLAVVDPGRRETLRRGRPGAMGLGTDQPSPRRPDGWRPPPRPDLMTGKTKPRREPGEAG